MFKKYYFIEQALKALLNRHFVELVIDMEL